MLLPREMAIGSHAKFVREGDAFAAGLDPDGGVIGAGVVSRLKIPAGNDPAWLDLGVIESWEDSVSEEEKELWGPNPGHLELNRIITTKQQMSVKLTTNQMSLLAAETFYRTQKLAAENAVFNPLSVVPRMGFLKLARFSEEDVEVLRMDLWCQLKCTAGFKGGGGEVIMPEFTARVLISPLNAGVIVPAAE